MLDYWRLPGPGRFLADVLSEIEAGRNVVVVLPDKSPSGMTERLRDALKDRWAVYGLRPVAQTPPIQAIYTALLGEVPLDSAMSAAELAADERLIGRIVFVEQVDDTSVVAWNDFIEDYEMGCRLLPANRRMLLMVSAKGKQACNPPKSEVALAVMSWNGWVSEVDMLVYASLRLQDNSWSHRKRQLIVTALAKVALWDTEVVEAFCDVNPEFVLEPTEVLLAVGRNRGWDVKEKPNWKDGSVHEIHGVEQTHSAFLACHAPKEVMRRVWMAQAGVLLPLVEERRVALLPRIGRYIGLPVETKSGVVRQLEDLEIGHIHWQLTAAGAERSLLRKFELLKRVRDALAHLNPLPIELALHPELVGDFRQ